MNPFRTALKSIRRSPNQSLAAFLVTFVTLGLMLVFAFGIYVGNRVLDYYESQPRLIVFFKSEISDEEAQTKYNNLANQANFTDLISEMNFVSKQEALDIYKNNYNDEALLSELLTADIFPASIEISTKDPNNMGTIKDALSVLDGIDEISYQEDVVETFLYWTNILRIAGLAIVAVFLLLTFFVIKIIIGMKVVDRRNSIGVMKILGANKLYVRAPFLYEGLIYGTVSCILAWGVIMTIILTLGDQIQSFFQPIPVMPINWQLSLLTLAVCLGLSILLSCGAAWTAVSRMLNKK